MTVTVNTDLIFMVLFCRIIDLKLGLGRFPRSDTRPEAMHPFRDYATARFVESGSGRVGRVAPNRQQQICWAMSIAPFRAALLLSQTQANSVRSFLRARADVPW